MTSETKRKGGDFVEQFDDPDGWRKVWVDGGCAVTACDDRDGWQALETFATEGEADAFVDEARDAIDDAPLPCQNCGGPRPCFCVTP